MNTIDFRRKHIGNSDKKITKVITVLSCKGATGKTTTTANLAYTLAKNFNYKVLVINADSYPAVIQKFGIESKDDLNLYEALKKGESLSGYIKKTKYENIDIVTSHASMVMIGPEFTKSHIDEILKPVVESREYDIILIDCSPRLDTFNTSVALASDGLIIPFTPSIFSVAGLENDLKFYNTILKQYNCQVKLIGLLLTRYKQRDATCIAAMQHIKDILFKMDGVDASLLFNTVIPEEEDLDQSKLLYSPTAVLYPDSASAKAYRKLAHEVIERIEY